MLGCFYAKMANLRTTADGKLNDTHNKDPVSVIRNQILKKNWFVTEIARISDFVVICGPPEDN